MKAQILPSVVALGSRLPRRFILLALGIAMLALLIAPAAAVDAGAPNSGHCRTYHVVQRGENLYQIARQYGLLWPVVAQANQITNPDRIYAGQRLCIPYGGTGSGLATVANCYYLNVRSGPGVGYGVVQVLSRGAQVALLGRNAAGSWIYIQTGSGRLGWVNAGYLASSTPIGTLPLAASTSGTIAFTLANSGY